MQTNNKALPQVFCVCMTTSLYWRKIDGRRQWAGEGHIPTDKVKENIEQDIGAADKIALGTAFGSKGLVCVMDRPCLGQQGGAHFGTGENGIRALCILFQLRLCAHLVRAQPSPVTLNAFTRKGQLGEDLGLVLGASRPSGFP